MSGRNILLPLLTAAAIVLAPSAEPGTDPAGESKLPTAQYGRVPPHFIRNDGQLDGEVGYYLKGPRGTVYLTRAEVVFDFISSRAEPAEGIASPEEQFQKEAGEEPEVSRLVFRLRFTRPNPETVLEGERELPGKINYFIGDREDWRTSIPTYEQVAYRGLYPGIDLICYLQKANIRYRYIIAPGADPGRIIFSYSGIQGLEINPSGDLIVLTPFGGFLTPAPRIYQEIDSNPVEIAGSFVTKDDSTVALKIPAYNRDRPLFIEF